MSLGYLALIIYDLYCKCLEDVFVKIMEVLVSDVQACGILQEGQARRCPVAPPWWQHRVVFPMGRRVTSRLRWHLGLLRQQGFPTVTLTMGHTLYLWWCTTVWKDLGDRCRRSCQLRGQLSRERGPATTEHSQLCRGSRSEPLMEFSWPADQKRVQHVRAEVSWIPKESCVILVSIELPLCSFMTVGFSFFSCRRRSFN